MSLLYRQFNRNKQECAREYAIKYPNENPPSATTILTVVKRLRETGSVRKCPKSARFTE